MNKRLYSIAELLKEFQFAEGLIEPLARAYVAEKSSIPKSKGKKKQKKVHKPQAQRVPKANIFTTSNHCLSKINN